MKKLLVAALAAFTFSACSDDDTSGDNFISTVTANDNSFFPHKSQRSTDTTDYGDELTRRYFMLSESNGDHITESIYIRIDYPKGKADISGTYELVPEAGGGNGKGYISYTPDDYYVYQTVDGGFIEIIDLGNLKYKIIFNEINLKRTLPVFNDNDNILLAGILDGKFTQTL